MIFCYEDFVESLIDAGFSMGGGNDEGIYAVINWSWGKMPPYQTPVEWHNGDPETDPWEWRVRVLDERDDIAYGKLFFKKSGFITKEWYPYFLATRRGDATFEEAYADGKISHNAKRIYEAVAGAEVLPVPLIKEHAGFSKDDKSAFDKALTELQMGMYLTVFGTDERFSQWAATSFCTTERFFGSEVFETAHGITKEAAHAKIREQVLKLNPNAQDKKITKFIFGS
ncbi:MAG: hypothetical protein FWB74_09655 [Defluviitaleaceae bacterium]|nr:hypothetical protein [Defluviitaleaceae bacterium]